MKAISIILALSVLCYLNATQVYSECTAKEPLTQKDGAIVRDENSCRTLKTSATSNNTNTICCYVEFDELKVEEDDYPDTKKGCIEVPITYINNEELSDIIDAIEDGTSAQGYFSTFNHCNGKNETYGCEDMSIECKSSYLNMGSILLILVAILL